MIDGPPNGLALSPDGSKLYISIGGLGFGLAVTPDGAEIYVTQSLAGRVQIVDRATLRARQPLETRGRPRRIAFDRRGTTGVVANEEGWVDFIR